MHYQAFELLVNLSTQRIKQFINFSQKINFSHKKKYTYQKKKKKYQFSSTSMHMKISIIASENSSEKSVTGKFHRSARDKSSEGERKTTKQKRLYNGQRQRTDGIRSRDRLKCKTTSRGSSSVSTSVFHNSDSAIRNARILTGYSQAVSRIFPAGEWKRRHSR